MNEIREICLTISFIVYVLLSSFSMCQSQHSNNADLSVNIQNTPAELIKSLVNEKIVSNITGRGARLSNYIMLLYNVLEVSGEAQHGNGQSYPRIRSFRGLKGGKGEFTFQLTNVLNKRVRRAEIVINLTRAQQAVGPVHRGTLYVRDPSFRIFEYDSQQYSSYLIFDITNIKETLSSNIFIDNVLKINNNRVRISQRNEPLLLIYENLDHNPLLIEENRNQRRKRHVEDIFDFYSGGVNMQSCRRYNWEIELSIFDGLDWWLHPRVYNAGYCDGQCSFPLTMETTNSTSYSFMKNVWHSQTFFLDEDIPRASCVPVDYEPLQIIHLTTNWEQDIMMIDNMIVKACGCL